MIARPQADLLSMLPVTQVAPLAAKALNGGVSPRFDAALLEAAKMMRDSAPQKPELALVPRVQQAFEGVLNELSQKPLDQLKTLVETPQAARPEIAAIVTRAAQAAGLNADERSALMDLVPLALPRLLDYKTQILIPGTPATNMTLGGVQPGPQGGTPVRVASPVDTDTSLEPGLQGQPFEPNYEDAPSSDAANTAGAGILLSQLSAAPVLVSTRTDDGSSKSSNLNQTSNVSNNSTGPVLPPPAALAPLAPQGNVGAPVLAPIAPDNAAPQGRVIQVSVSQQQVTGPAPAPAQPQAAAPAQSPAPEQTAAPAPQGARTAAPVQAQPGSDSALQAAFANAEARPEAPLAGSVVVASTQPQGSAPQDAAAVKPLLRTAPSTPPQAAAVDLDLQFQDPFQPLAVVPGSELTLQEDGTWTQPAPVKTAQPAVIAPQGAPTTEPSAAPVQAPQAPQATAPVAAQAGLPQSTTVPADGAEIQAPVQVPSAPAAAQAVQATVQAQVPAAVVPQSPAQPATVMAQPVDPHSPAESQPTLADAFQAPAAAVPARRSAADSAFNGLAQPGQDPLKSLAQQTARDYAVRESVFKQVYEALREAPEAETGRMLIRLKPAELGEVHIDLVMVNGKLSARLVTSQVEVRDAFVRDLPSFKAGLESQGVAVRDITVAVRAGVADQQQQAPQQQPDPQAWWRELPRNDQALSLGVPASAGYTNLSVTDQRFSALA